MGKVTFKAYTNPKSLASKLAGTVASKFIAPKFNKETLVFTVGKTTYKGRRADPSDVDSEIICEIPGTDVILSDRNTAVPISHDMILDMSNPTDSFIYDLALASGLVAASKSEINPVEGHAFYIQDEEADAIKVSGKADLAYDAMELVREMDIIEKTDLARMLGQYVLNMTERQVDGFVKQMCIDDPKKIIATLADKDYKHRVFVKSLQDSNILRYNNGKYMYYQQLIGVDMDHVVSFVKDPQNADLITNWGRLLNDGNVIDVSEEVVNEALKKGRGRPKVKTEE